MVDMTQAEYLRLHPEAGVPTYCGERADRGLIMVGRHFPNEGYAVMRCGGTEVRIGYSLLHILRLVIDKDSMMFSDLCELQRAFHSITCEASLGRNGDEACAAIAKASNHELRPAA
jgi:hypothetical protein